VFLNIINIQIYNL